MRKVPMAIEKLLSHRCNIIARVALDSLFTLAYYSNFYLDFVVNEMTTLDTLSQILHRNLSRCTLMTLRIAKFLELLACQQSVQLKYPRLVVQIALNMIKHTKSRDVLVLVMNSLSGIILFCNKRVQLAKEFGIINVIFWLFNSDLNSI